MKNVVKTFTATVVAAVILIQNANAQTAMGGVLANSAPGSSTYSMDNATGEHKANYALSDIHPRAIQDFQRSFKDITSEKWSKLDNGYIASFTIDSVKTKVAYNRHGIRNYTLQYYNEQKLPREVRNMVKSVYYDYAIFNVIEVNLNDQPIYLVYMRDETHLKTIRVSNGEMQEVQNYTRG